MISALIILSFFGITLLYTRNIVSSRRYLLKNARSTKGQAKNDIIILIPAYREAEIVADTLRYYSEVAGVCNIRVIFVTTEVEGDTTTNKTYLTLKKLIGKEPNILLEHYPKTHGSKGSQLNMVMDKYQSQTDYFAIFDIDSRPDIRGIQYVQQATTKTDVYQMPSVYLPHPSNTLASQTMSVFQSRWSYCFEIPKWRQWQANPGKSQVMYTVGHGLFIRNDVRFSEKTIAEDLELGYRLAARGTTLSIVPFFDYALVPKKFTTAIIQSSRWYYGELVTPIGFWRHIRDTTTNNRLQYGIRSTVRYIQILLWMLGPILVIGSLVLAIPNKLFIALGLGTVVMHLCMHAFICSYTHSSYRSLLLMPFKLIINGAGPMLCVVYALLDTINLRKLRFVKTER